MKRKKWFIYLVGEEKKFKFQQQKAVLQPFKPVDVYFSRLLIDEFKEI